MLRFIRYRGEVILASETMLKKHLKKMKEHVEFAKRLKESERRKRNESKNVIWIGL